MRNLTEISCIIDKSGSMGHLVNDVIGSYNTFIQGQKELAGDARMSLITFSDTISKVYESLNLSEVTDLTRQQYIPTGGTALYDAIGNTIVSLGARLASMTDEERPNKVIVVILTDGEENSSREFTKDKIAEMIEHQKTNYAWQFVFLAANQDACLAAESIGISKGNAMYFSGSAVSLSKTSDNLKSYMSRTRSASQEVYLASMDSAFLADEQDARDESDKN